MKLSVTSLAGLLCLLVAQSHAYQGVTLWDVWTGTNVSYPSIAFNSYVEDLSEYDFDDLTSAACVSNGLWFLYEDGAFNTYSSGDTAVVFGDDGACRPLSVTMNNKVSSIRYGGPPGDYRWDSLSTYKKANFGGRETYNLFDAPSVEYDSPQSIAVTGNSSWTIYSLPMYQGEALCLPAGPVPSQPGLFPNTGLTWPFIYSARKGCDPAARRLAPLPAQSSPLLLPSSSSASSPSD